MLLSVHTTYLHVLQNYLQIVGVIMMANTYVRYIQGNQYINVKVDTGYLY